MPDSTGVSTPSAPAPSAPASSPAPSSPTSTPSAPASETTSTATPTKAPVSARELIGRKLEEAKAKAKAAETPTATAGESAEKTAIEDKGEAAPQVAAPEDGLPEKLPDLKPGEYPEIPRDIRQALNAIQDKKVREQIARLTFVGKGFTELRMTPSEGAELRKMYPTLQVAQQAHQASSSAYDLAQAFHSNTPEGVDHFLTNLSGSNPQAFNTLVERVTENLAQHNKPAYRKVANSGLRNLIANMRARAEIAERNGDSAKAHEYTTAALINEEFAFPQGVQPRPQANQQVQQVQQQLQQLQAEKSAFQQQQKQQAFRYVTDGVEASLAKQAEAFIKDADPDGLYPKKGRDGLIGRIVNGVREKVRSNPHVGVTLSGFLDQGNVQGAQEFLDQQARNHINAVAQEALDGYAEEFGAIQQSRQAKLAQVVTMKDVGSAGASLPKGSNKPVDLRGLTTKQKIMALAEAKGLR